LKLVHNVKALTIGFYDDGFVFFEKFMEKFKTVLAAHSDIVPNVTG